MILSPLLRAWRVCDDERDPAKPVNPLRYVGKEGYYTDVDTGLMLLGARYYDPLIGRFITQDPDRDGLNWYEYCGDDPVNAVDPTGSEQLPPGACPVGSG